MIQWRSPAQGSVQLRDDWVLHGQPAGLARRLWGEEAGGPGRVAGDVACRHHWPACLAFHNSGGLPPSSCLSSLHRLGASTQWRTRMSIDGAFQGFM